MMTTIAMTTMMAMTTMTPYLSVIINDGTGVFGSPQFFDAGQAPDFVTLSDLDGDSDLDIVLVHYGAETDNLLIYFNLLIP